MGFLVKRRGFCAVLQFFYFVFEMQFLSLQFEELEVTRGWMEQFRLYLPFEHLVATHEFREMVIQRHPSTPFVADPFNLTQK